MFTLCAQRLHVTYQTRNVSKRNNAQQWNEKQMKFQIDEKQMYDEIERLIENTLRENSRERELIIFDVSTNFANVDDDKNVDDDEILFCN